MAFKNYTTEAGWSKLVGKLGAFNKGDDLPFPWVCEHSGAGNAVVLESRLRTYFKKRGIVIVRDASACAWHLLTNEAQVAHVDARIRRSRREKARAFGENRSLEREALGPTDRNRADHQQRYLVQQLEDDAKHERERKALIGAPTPPPRLVAAKAK